MAKKTKKKKKGMPSDVKAYFKCRNRGGTRKKCKVLLKKSR